MADTWYCETCDARLKTREEVIQHLKAVHGDTTGKGVTQWLGHMDFDTWHTTSWRFVFDCGARVVKTYTSTRAKDDPMRGEA